MSHFPPIEDQLVLIRRNAEEIIPETAIIEKLKLAESSNTPLQIKLGCDPSRPDLHIGHAVVLRKLRDFQRLGHAVTLVVGDFTAMIGDPTGRNKTRPQLTLEEAHHNAQSYIDQASVILDENRLNVVYNSKWLNALNFNDVIALASKYTVARMLERDDFTKRYRDGIPISIHEFLYPLAQAYDSVALKSDIEIGGTDQKFNLLVGRDLQKEYGQEPQVIITMPLLVGTDGVEKMSKSMGNYIGITDPPDQIYGKTLSIPDTLIATYFKYGTEISADDLSAITSDLEQGRSNPRDLKRRLARELVTLYHDESAALQAEQEFDKLFISKENPDEMPEYKLTESEKLISIIVKNGLLSSNGDARRMIQQGGVKLDGEKVSDPFQILSPESEHVIKVGKRKFLRIVS
ncbi:MAG: tyrosine--tRNA ligase [FCB group bacterium]|nr:tyrosine--tRNA ligase [FCB group bacterium]